MMLANGHFDLSKTAWMRTTKKLFANNNGGGNFHCPGIFHCVIDLLCFSIYKSWLRYFYSHQHWLYAIMAIQYRVGQNIHTGASLDIIYNIWIVSTLQCRRMKHLVVVWVHFKVRSGFMEIKAAFLSQKHDFWATPNKWNLCLNMTWCYA